MLYFPKPDNYNNNKNNHYDEEEERNETLREKTWEKKCFRIEQIR